MAVRTVRSGASGSAISAVGAPKGRVAVRLVRPGASGSASHTATRYRTHRIDTPKGRVAVREVRPGPSGSALGAPRAEWKCGSHCHSAVNVRGGTFRGEWQRDSVRWGPSGSAIGAVGALKGQVAVRLTLPLGIERTESARPRGEWQCAWRGRRAQGASGSALGTPRAEWKCGSHYRSAVNVRGGTPRAEWQWGWCLGASFGPVGAASASRRSSELTGDDPFAKKNLSLQQGGIAGKGPRCGQGDSLQAGSLSGWSSRLSRVA